MEREEKTATIYHYVNDVCVCGKDKKRYRWVCLSCREKLVNSLEYAELDWACEEHMIKAQALLEKAKQSV